MKNRNKIITNTLMIFVLVATILYLLTFRPKRIVKVGVPVHVPVEVPVEVRRNPEFRDPPIKEYKP